MPTCTGVLFKIMSWKWQAFSLTNTPYKADVNVRDTGSTITIFDRCFKFKASPRENKTRKRCGCATRGALEMGNGRPKEEVLSFSNAHNRNTRRPDTRRHKKVKQASQRGF